MIENPEIMEQKNNQNKYRKKKKTCGEWLASEGWQHGRHEPIELVQRDNNYANIEFKGMTDGQMKRNVNSRINYSHKVSRWQSRTNAFFFAILIIN